MLAWHLDGLIALGSGRLCGSASTTKLCVIDKLYTRARVLCMAHVYLWRNRVRVTKGMAARHHNRHGSRPFTIPHCFELRVSELVT